MRALLAGELDQAQAFESDYYVKLEVHNGSGTWFDVGAALGKAWIVNATWGETVDAKVSEATFTLVQQIGTASLSPLMASSPLNVNDLGAYAPLLDVGRLVRASTATMAARAALDVAQYRPIFTGRINEVDQTDAQDTIMAITIRCSDLGAWLTDLQIETSGTQYGTKPVGTALETVMQNIITANIPAGEPAVTLYKQSTSSFLVTDWQQGDTKLMEALTTLVLDSVGEDIRYRFDAAHASRLTWFNPDRARTTVDATFSRYVLRQLGLSIADIRNVIGMPFTGGVATGSSTSSIAKYRRRFNRLPASPMIITSAQAQKVADAVVNDLSAPPGEASADIPYFWPVQLYDRYTFTANARQFDQDQTFAVMGYQHTIENGRGVTTLTLTARIVGAYSEWLKRIGTPETPTSDLYDVTVEELTTTEIITFRRSPAVAEVWAAYAIVPATSGDYDYTTLVAPFVTPLPDGATSYTVPKPGDGFVTLVQLEPRLSDLVVGTVRRLAITATSQVPHLAQDDAETDTTGTQLIRLTERGIRIVLVEVRTQVGESPISAWRAVARTAGALSLIPGHGVLVSGEYEDDVTLDLNRQTSVTFQWTLANGAKITSPDFWFDRNKLPQLVALSQSGSIVTVQGDSGDTKSVGLYAKADPLPTNYLVAASLNNFTHAAWLKIGGITAFANAAIAPDGTMTATRLTQVAGGLVAQISSLPGVAGQTVSAGFWLKSAGTATQASIRVDRDGIAQGNQRTVAISSVWTWFPFTVTLDANTSTPTPRLDPVNGELFVWGAYLGSAPSGAPGMWKYEVDGISGALDVTRLGTNGVAGLSAGTAGTFTAKALSDPVVNIGAGTLSAVKDITVQNGAAAPPASWITVQATAPATGGSTDVAISLHASAAPAGWTARVLIADDGGAAVDQSGALTPTALTVPPTALTVYNYAAFNARSAGFGVATLRLVNVVITAELRDAGGVVRATSTVQVSYYTETT